MKLSQGRIADKSLEFDNDAERGLGSGRSGIGSQYADRRVAGVMKVGESASNLFAGQGGKYACARSSRAFDVVRLGPTKLGMGFREGNR
jgi:hypothetical protein